MVACACVEDGAGEPIRRGRPGLEVRSGSTLSATLQHIYPALGAVPSKEPKAEPNTPAHLLVSTPAKYEAHSNLSTVIYSLRFDIAMTRLAPLIYRIPATSIEPF